MALASRRDQRRDPGFLAGLDVRFTEIAAIGQQGLGAPQRLAKSGELVQRRCDLLLVIGGLNHIVGDHQHAARRHRGRAL